MSARSSKSCCASYRYVVLVVAGLQLSFILVSVITFNAAFVAMQDISTSPLYEGVINGSSNSTDWSSSDLPMAERRFVWGFLEKSLSFAGAFGSAVVGTQPIGMLILRFGAHRSMTIMGAVGALAVAFTPFAISWSFPLFVVVRVINGLTFGNLFPVAGMIVNEWAPLSESGIFVAVLTGHVEISALYAMPVGAAVATSVSWPFVFWLNGAILGVITLLWTLLYRDRPSVHPFVSADEVAAIAKGKAERSNKPAAVPHRGIFSSAVIWSTWIAAIGTFFVAQFSITWAPVYISRVLGYSTAVTGVITIFPLLAQMVIKVGTGLLSDKLTCINEVLKLRLFNSVALIGASLFFAVATIVQPTGGAHDVFLAVAPMALLGFHSGGFPKCIVMVSRQHSSFVLSIVQMIACSSLLVGSFVVPALTPDNTFAQWRKVFIIYALLLVLCNTIFVVCAKPHPALWTQEKVVEESEQSKEERDEPTLNQPSV